jgi:hypothetical protein
VRAEWLTWRDEATSQIEFFKLSKNGKLADRTLSPDHRRPFVVDSALKSVVPEMRYSVKESESTTVFQSSDSVNLFDFDSVTAESTFEWGFDDPFNFD